MLETILLPVDITEIGQKAVEVAKNLAKKFGSKVWIITVLENPKIPFLDELPEEEKKAIVSLQEKINEKAKEILNQYVRQLKEEGIDANYDILKGDTVETILDFSEKIHPSLIVIPSHNKTDLEIKALGSVSLRVASKSNYPVLVLKGKQPLNFKKILVSYDFLHSSQKALEFAVSIAKSFNSKLIVVYADNDFGHSHIKSIMEKVKQRKLEKLNEIKSLYPDTDIFMEEGTPEHVIIKKANEEDVDLIIIGKRQVSQTKRVFIGSTSYKILKESNVSVLVYRGNHE
jgi:nucleotide-binding universal stress UspA family protein